MKGLFASHAKVSANSLPAALMALSLESSDRFFLIWHLAAQADGSEVGHVADWDVDASASQLRVLVSWWWWACDELEAFCGVENWGCFG